MNETSGTAIISSNVESNIATLTTCDPHGKITYWYLLNGKILSEEHVFTPQIRHPNRLQRWLGRILLGELQ